jgi:hypothetical protein
MANKPIFVSVLKTINFKIEIMNPLTRTVKSVIGAVLMLLVFTTSATAQEKAAEGALAVSAKMKEMLSLNEQQYNKVLEVNKVYLRKIAAAKKDGLTTAEMDKKLRVYSNERENKLKSVLTPSQYKTYAARRESVQDMLKKYYED